MVRHGGKGYTILETLIVLGVSSLMFIVAVVAFNGRQQQVQFTQAMRDFDAKLQDYMNDVTTGYFNNDGQLRCYVSTPSDTSLTTGRPTIDTLGSEGQGSSDDCIYVGKVIQFRPDIAEDPESTIVLYDLIGRRTTPKTPPAIGTDPTENIQEARPRVVDEAGDEILLNSGLRITRVATRDASGTVTNIGAVGFFTSFASNFSVGLDATDVSNNQAVRYASLAGSSINQDKASAVGLINLVTDNAAESGGTFADLGGGYQVIVCLQNAEETKRAAIVIGKDGSTSTEVQFDTYDEAICG